MTHGAVSPGALRRVPLCSCRCPVPKGWVPREAVFGGSPLPHLELLLPGAVPGLCPAKGPGAHGLVRGPHGDVGSAVAGAGWCQEPPLMVLHVSPFAGAPGPCPPLLHGDHGNDAGLSYPRRPAHPRVQHAAAPRMLRDVQRAALPPLLPPAPGESGTPSPCRLGLVGSRHPGPSAGALPRERERGR